jgi:hypothetical protein
MKIMSEVDLVLPNTDHLQQDEVYVRGYLHLVEGGQYLVELDQPLT